MQNSPHTSGDDMHETGQIVRMPERNLQRNAVCAETHPERTFLPRLRPPHPDGALTMSSMNSDRAGLVGLMEISRDARGAADMAGALRGPEATPRAPLTAAVAVGVAGVFARIAARWQARSTCAELAESEDRMLADVGLTRRDAPRPAPSTALRDLYR